MVKENWGSRIGFVAAAAGSAVGLGNIWRFPYVAGENGGGAFLIIYLGIVFTLGLGLVLAEMALGNASQLPPIKGGRKEFGSKIGILFWGTMLSSFLLMSIYSIVGGWTITYAVESLSSHFNSSPWLEFSNVLSNPLYLIGAQGAFIASSAVVLLFGVKEGLEKCCKYLMPVLFVIILILVARALTMEGSGPGLEFYFTPDFSKVTPGTLLSAMSMAFFSLSLGMGAIITYASYLRKGAGILSPGIWMVVLDTSVCFLAGVFIFPAVFAAGVDPASGPTLVFEVLPKIFNELPMGFLFSFAFFTLLFVAALTSAISLLEVVAAHFINKKNSRAKVTSIASIATFICGVPSALAFNHWSGIQIMNLNIFDMVDKLITSVLMPLNGLLISILVGWVLHKRASQTWTSNENSLTLTKALWINCCRLLFPAVILYIMIDGLWEFISSNI